MAKRTTVYLREDVVELLQINEINNFSGLINDLLSKNLSSDSKRFVAKKINCLREKINLLESEISFLLKEMGDNNGKD